MLVNSRFYTYKPARGFTLSEVLITVSIVGIIAAFAIIPLTSFTGDLALKLALKAAVSNFSKACQRIAADNDGTLVGVFTDDATSLTVLKTYLNYVQECGTTGKICWHAPNDWHYFSGDVVGGASIANGNGLILSDGSLINIRSSDGTCSQDGIIKGCISIRYDVNGFAPPNIVGRDIYYLYFNAKNAVIPRGLPGSMDYINCGPGTQGLGCAAWVLIDKNY